MIKRIFYFTIFLVSFLLATGGGAAQAAVSLPDFSSTNNLPDFISSIYSFAITVVGIAVFIRVLYAGFLMLTAAGNAGKWNDARNKMQNAVIGAILLFAAYLILYVINPDLVSNTFRFTVPGGGQQTNISAPTAKVSSAGGPGGIVGMVPAGGRAASFHGLPVANAQEGIYSFTIKVVDRNGNVCRQTYNIEVLPKTAAIDAPSFYAGHSVASKYAAILNAANAQEETAIPVRYVRIESTSNSWVAWREIEIYDENNQKITPVSATVSSEWCTAAIRQAVPTMCVDWCCNPSNLYDGNPNTLWNGGGVNADGSPRGCQTYYPNSRVCQIWAPLTAWVQLDLGGAKSISKVRLLTENSPNPVQATHKLSISSSGTNFSLVHEFSGNISSNAWLEYQGPFVAEEEAEESAGEIKTIQSGGCIIGTRILPDAVENTPYYAEIVVAGQAPFSYEIEDGSLPGGLSLVSALDMPILTIKNLTAQRNPISAFKVGDVFLLELTNAVSNSPVYFKWYKNGSPWFYPGITPNKEGWSEFGKTNGDGKWVNQAAFTTNEIALWQEYAMVGGGVSKVIEFQVLAPEVVIVVQSPTSGANTPVYSGYSGGGGGGCSLTPYRCEDKETGEITELTTEDEVRECSRNEGGEDRLLYPECTYSGYSRADCAQYDFEARNCAEEIDSLRGEDGYVDPSDLPHSSDGNPPTDVPAGSLYTTDQYSGDNRLGGDNLLVRCRYSDQAEAVHCGEMSSGEYCLPDGRNAGYNESWCAGKTDSSGEAINPLPDEE